jgi:hypothetical protein
MEISTKNLRNETAPLYNRYPRQTNAQPAYIALDEHGNVCAATDPEIGNGVPFDVWHRRALRWYIPASVRGDVLADFLESAEVVTLLERVHIGHSVEWDGNNHVGSLDDDAQSASDEFITLIEESFSDDDVATVWPVDEWLFGGCTLRDHWPNEKTLDEVVAELESEAESENIYIDGDVETALLDNAAWRFEQKPDELGRVHVDALLANDRISQDDVAGWIAAMSS